MAAASHENLFLKNIYLYPTQTMSLFRKQQNQDIHWKRPSSSWIRFETLPLARDLDGCRRFVSPRLNRLCLTDQKFFEIPGAESFSCWNNEWCWMWETRPSEPLYTLGFVRFNSRHQRPAKWEQGIIRGGLCKMTSANGKKRIKKRNGWIFEKKVCCLWSVWS